MPLGEGVPVPLGEGVPVPLGEGVPVPLGKRVPVPSGKGLPLPLGRGLPVPLGRGLPAPLASCLGSLLLMWHSHVAGPASICIFKTAAQTINVPAIATSNLTYIPTYWMQM